MTWPQIPFVKYIQKGINLKMSVCPRDSEQAKVLRLASWGVFDFKTDEQIRIFKKVPITDGEFELNFSWLRQNAKLRKVRISIEICNDFTHYWAMLAPLNKSWEELDSMQIKPDKEKKKAHRIIDRAIKKVNKLGFYMECIDGNGDGISVDDSNDLMFWRAQ